MRTAVLVLLCASAACAPASGVAGNAEAITNADVAPDDVAVVGLMRAGVVYCSGAVVADHFVLTAAHCVADAPPDEVLFVAADGRPTTIGVHGIHVDPDYTPGTLRADLALVELADASPFSPLPMATQDIVDGDVGAEVRVVGFGRAEAAVDPGALPARRAGLSTLAAYTLLNFTMTPGPSQTCVGDSGGPTFWLVDGVEVIVGVHSFGDPTCAEFATDVRVDAYIRDFLRPTMDAHALDFTARPPGLVGQSCSTSSRGTAAWPLALVLALATLATRRFRTMATIRLLSIVSLLVLATSCANGLGDSHKWDTGIAEAPLMAVPPSEISSSRLQIGKWYVYRFRDGLSVVGLGTHGELQRNVRYRFVTTGHSGTALAVESIYPERAHGLVLADGSLAENTFEHRYNALATVLAVQHDADAFVTAGIVPYEGGCPGALLSAGMGCAPFIGAAATALTTCGGTATMIAGAGGICTATAGWGCAAAVLGFAGSVARSAGACVAAGGTAYSTFDSCRTAATSAWDTCTGSGMMMDPSSMDPSSMDPSSMDPSSMDPSSSTDPGTGDPSMPGSDPGGGCFDSSGSACCDPSACDTTAPSMDPSSDPSSDPSTPSTDPSTDPSTPSTDPSTDPSTPSTDPSSDPSTPSSDPSSDPSYDTADSGSAGGDDFSYSDV